MTCGDTLTADTTLTADLTCAGSALTIGAADVDLDLNGHTITGTGTGTALRVSPWTGTVVHNGTIDNFAYGVDVDGQGGGGSGRPRLTLTDVRLHTAPVKAMVAILAISGTHDTCHLSGLRLLGGQLTIDRCTVTEGTSIVSSNGSAIRDSVLTGGYLSFTQADQGDITRNVFDAFPLSSSTESRRNLITSNVFKNAQDAAVVLGETFKPEDASVVEHNLFTGNDIGFASRSMLRSVIVRKNVFSGNHTAGIFVENRSGLTWSTPHPISNNVFIGNGRRPSGQVDSHNHAIRGGIHLDAPTDLAPPVTLTGNVGVGNAGYLIWAPPGRVADGGGNQGPCGPTPNPDLTCW